MFPRVFYGAYFFAPRYFAQAQGAAVAAIASIVVTVKAAIARVTLSAVE